jgi:hypothetical protein
LQKYLPLKQRSLCAGLLHMEKHGNIAPIIVSVSHFEKSLFVFTQPGPEQDILGIPGKVSVAAILAVPVMQSVLPRTAISCLLRIAYEHPLHTEYSNFISVFPLQRTSKHNRGSSAK